MVLAEGSTPDEAVNLSLITRPLLDGGRGGVDRARLDWDFKPDGRNRQHGNIKSLLALFSSTEILFLIKIDTFTLKTTNSFYIVPVLHIYKSDYCKTFFFMGQGAV